MRIVFLGATGAVGSHALRAAEVSNAVKSITCLNRRDSTDHALKTTIAVVDTVDENSYASLLPGHDVAICTFGVGEPSKVSNDTFVHIDKTAVLDFARACKASGIRHFQLLNSVGANPKSSVFYLRIKGELLEALKDLNFERLSIFQPSMIITPENRYGLSQAVTLKVWPWLTPALIGPLRKYRGVNVDQLGAAFVRNLGPQHGFERLYWDEIVAL